MLLPRRPTLSVLPIPEGKAWEQNNPAKGIFSVKFMPIKFAHWFLLLAVLGVFSSGHASDMQESDVHYDLIADSAYKDKTHVLISFRIRNSGTRNLKILRWGTLLEPFAGDILAVSCNRQTLKYHGPMVKRGQPTADDYVYLQPGGALEQTGINLAEVYSFPPQGGCMIDLDPFYLRRAVRVVASEDREVSIDGRATPFEMAAGSLGGG